MAIVVSDKVLAEWRTVWQYDLAKTTVEEIIEYFDTNYGITMNVISNVFGNGEPQLVFRSSSGSTSHYMSTGDFLIIDQNTREYDVISDLEYGERTHLAESLFS